MAPRRTLVTGCYGQLGRAVKALADERGLSGFDCNDIDTFDFSDASAYDGIDWDLYGTVINCGAYTAVDRAETPEGRTACWKANALGPALLARTCAEHDITLVHISSDYVFDGTAEEHTEEETFSPLSVYGQAKAAGDIAVAGCPKHYIARSSWVIGDGRNFVKTMGVLVGFCCFLSVMDGPESFPRQIDTVFHLARIRAYAESGTFSVLDATNCFPDGMKANGARNEKIVPVSEMDPEVLAEAGVTEDVLANPSLENNVPIPMRLWRGVPYDKHYLPDFALSSRPRWVVKNGTATLAGGSLATRTIVFLDPTRTKGAIRHMSWGASVLSAPSASWRDSCSLAYAAARERGSPLMTGASCRAPTQNPAPSSAETSPSSERPPASRTTR